jgi:hypothetical protein
MTGGIIVRMTQTVGMKALKMSCMLGDVRYTREYVLSFSDVSGSERIRKSLEVLSEFLGEASWAYILIFGLSPLLADRPLLQKVEKFCEFIQETPLQTAVAPDNFFIHVNRAGFM